MQIIDSWNPKTFDIELINVLTKNSNLILDYHAEDNRLMDDYLNGDIYESRKPNQYSAAYLPLLENVVTPLFYDRCIRVWHYTRLLEDEVTLMRKKLEPSTLYGLQQRIDAVKKKGLLTSEEAQIIYDQSVIHSQKNNRPPGVWTTTVPLPPDDDGVKPLLKSWGGESAYFWLSDKTVKEKLKTIGTPRIVEIKTALQDNLNAFSVAERAMEVWAKNLGVAVKTSGSDLLIMHCLKTAHVLRVHTAGEGVFKRTGKTYPDNSSNLVDV